MRHHPRLEPQTGIDRRLDHNVFDLDVLDLDVLHDLDRPDLGCHLGHDLGRHLDLDHDFGRHLRRHRIPTSDDHHHSNPKPPPPHGPHSTTPPSLADMERDYIRHVLEQCNHNKSEAARIPGIGRNTLLRKIRGG